MATRIQTFPDRRRFLLALAGGTGFALAGSGDRRTVRSEQDPPSARKAPTQFQIACMTLPYSRFPLARALEGIRAAGYRYVAWGTTHVEENGEHAAVMAADAHPDRARELGQRCRDLGLEPLMMFAGLYPESADYLEVMQNRIRQAAAGGVPQVLAFGHTQRGDRDLWVRHFKTLGPVAREHGVLLVIKPHGGLTGTGAMAAGIVRDVADEGVKVCYDSGNVMHYQQLDAAATLDDLRRCAREVHSFCIKDYRHWPQPQGCGPGLGEMDHYRLLHPVAFTGREMPLCCENIFAPAVPRPNRPEEVDRLARRAREFLELVVAGVQADDSPR
jgi:sugar phosphate isomerase/epimerase